MREESSTSARGERAPVNVACIEDIAGLRLVPVQPRSSVAAAGGLRATAQSQQPPVHMLGRT